MSASASRSRPPSRQPRRTTAASPRRQEPHQRRTGRVPRTYVLTMRVLKRGRAVEAARSRLAGARAELAAPGGSPARNPRKRPHSTQGGRGRSIPTFPPATASKRTVWGRSAKARAELQQRPRSPARYPLLRATPQRGECRGGRSVTHTPPTLASKRKQWPRRQRETGLLRQLEPGSRFP